MALFKIFKGTREQLDDVKKREGFAYFTEDTQELFIDTVSDDPETGTGGMRLPVIVSSIYVDGEIIDTDQLAKITDEIDVEHGGTGQTSLSENAILIGNDTDGIKTISINDKYLIAGSESDGVQGIAIPTTPGTVGALYALANELPQFGTIPVEAGGTNATNVVDARTNLDVYSKEEVRNLVQTATTVSYTTTLTIDGWGVDKEEDGYYHQNYVNIDLKCGTEGNVPPIIVSQNEEADFNLISQAIATSKVGITFMAETRPTMDIDLIIIDNK